MYGLITVQIGQNSLEAPDRHCDVSEFLWKGAFVWPEAIRYRLAALCGVADQDAQLAECPQGPTT